MGYALANYKKERRLFEQLLAAECDSRILLLQGGSGVGKTTLLQVCLSAARKHGQFHCVPLDFKGAALDILDLLHQIGEAVEWENLANFTQVIEQIHSSTVNVNLKANSLIGFKNRLQVILPSENSEQQKMVLLELTKALLIDLKSLERAVLFIFDTYEKALQEVQDWVFQHLLTEVAKNAGLRVVLAGQTVPDEKTIQWGHCCTLQPLKPSFCAEDWLPVITELNRKIPHNMNPLQFLDVLCKNEAFYNPATIRKFIEGLPFCEDNL
ncbi:MAG: AAA family ATPase [Thiotrichaceae bacterium]|nr:AAA family ATPase [Thiotrichaceae bacterium]